MDSETELSARLPAQPVLVEVAEPQDVVNCLVVTLMAAAAQMEVPVAQMAVLAARMEDVSASEEPAVAEEDAPVSAVLCVPMVAAPVVLVYSQADAVASVVESSDAATRLLRVVATTAVPMAVARM